MDTLHPALVHFAIVLPLVAFTLQFLFLRTKKSCYSAATMITLVFATVFVIAAWYSGKADAKEVYETLMTYTENGAVILKNHGALGFYIMIALGLVTVLKIVLMKIQNSTLEILLLVALIVLSPMLLLQGKSGGDIVYKNGALFEYPEDEEEDE